MRTTARKTRKPVYEPVLKLPALPYEQFWFEQGASEDVDALLIHEFGHEYSGDHLSSDYHEALCRLGASLKKLALEKPEALRQFLP
jgi:hypothetical protein